MRQLFYKFFLFGLLPNSPFLQTSADFETQFSVSSVYFFSPNFDSNSGVGWHHIKKDGQSQGHYSFNPLMIEAWTSNSAKPVGYVSGNNVLMGGFVRIQSCDANTTGPFYVKAVASNGMIFKPKLGIL